ncbi:MAG: hypothetical protein VKO64_12655 [Candidatus Sericytochromatia bacterium]|nr:hypothetical protein [Candidatus Sericytochromatia bacterium]
MTPETACITLAADEPAPGGDGLRVDGPFGASGWYPVETWPRDAAGRAGKHCPVWFLKTGLPEAARARAAVVSERTHVTLVLATQTWQDEAICTRCRNEGCPANAATEEKLHAQAGRLIV